RIAQHRVVVVRVAHDGRAGVAAAGQRVAAVLAERGAEHAGDVLGRPARRDAVLAGLRQRAERPALADLVLHAEPAPPQLVAEQGLRGLVGPELRHQRSRYMTTVKRTPRSSRVASRSAGYARLPSRLRATASPSRSAYHAQPPTRARSATAASRGRPAST